MSEVKVRILERSEGGKLMPGDIVYMTKKGAEHYVETGAAEYIVSTCAEEFSKFLSQLPQTPILIPIIPNGKNPDVPKGESWKDSKYHLTPEQALTRLKEGKNVGVVANDWLVIVDLDNPEKFMLPIKTLTVQTRNGARHLYFTNAGDVENAVGKNTLAKCGEVRAEWQYVLAPGSFVPKDNEREEGNGLYKIIDPSPIATLQRKDLPEDFVPTSSNHEIDSEILKTPLTIRNKHGWDLDDIRKYDPKLNDLLDNKNDEYPSPSEADMATLSKLLYYEYTEGEAVAILKKYRERPKLERTDYIIATLSRINIKDKISDHKNVKTWNPNKINKPSTTEDKTPNMAEILKNLKEEYIFKTPIDIEDIYYYKDGIYKPAEHIIKANLENKLEAKATTHFIEEVLNHIRRSSYVEREEFNRQSYIIPVKNGLLNLSKLVIEPFSPDKIFTYHLNVTYNPEKKCPKFLQFIEQVLIKEDIPTLQEYLGYCLVPAMPYHKMMWFYGVGRNGKGRITATIQELFGWEHCSDLNLEEFSSDRRFSTAQLYGKMINVSSEPATHKTLHTPILKKITGEDHLEAEIKNKQRRIKFINFAKMFVLGNRFPKVNDNTTAFWDRVLLIKFPFSFIGKDQIPNIEKTWVNDPDEMSGILNWMIEGIKRLLDNNEFTVSKSTKDATLEFKRVSDTILAFLDEQCEPDRFQAYTRQDFYELYKEYCDAYGLIIEEEKVFIGKIKQNPKIKSRQKRIDGKMVRVWVGIKVKPLTPDDTEDTSQTTLSSPSTEAHEAGEAGKYNSFSVENNITREKELETGASCASSASLDTKNLVFRKCVACRSFRKPSCPRPDWEHRNGNENASGYPCFVLLEMSNFDDKCEPQGDYE